MDKNIKLDRRDPKNPNFARYLALSAAMMFASGAQAQLLNNLTIASPKALAMGNAVTADPPGIDSIHFNPAGLAKIKGRQMNLKLFGATLDADGNIGAPTKPTNDIKQAFYQSRYVSGDCTGADPSGPVPQEDLDNCWGIDPIGNTSHSLDGFGLMLPLAGFTEVPILAFPAGGVAFEDPKRGLTFGTAVYIPQGIGFTRKDIDPQSGLGDSGAYQGVNVGVTRLTYFSPSVGMQVNSKLSIGVGVNFSYQGMQLDTYIRAPLETTQWLDSVNQALPADLDLDILRPYETVGRLSMELEDFMSVGFNFGFIYEYNSWLTVGFTYQSETISQLRGDYQMENTPAFQATAQGLMIGNPFWPAFGGGDFNGTAVEQGTVELEYILPQSFNWGSSVQIVPGFKVNFDVRWVEYSVWDELEYKFSNNLDYLNLASIIYTFAKVKDNADANEMRIRRDYEDTWSFSLGAEYQWSDNLVLRVGYEPRTGAIPDSSADLLFPIGDAEMYSAGFGWQMDKRTRIEGAFAVLFSEQDIPACRSENANTCNEGDTVYNPYYSMPFDTETTAYIVNLSIDRKF